MIERSSLMLLGVLLGTGTRQCSRCSQGLAATWTGGRAISGSGAVYIAARHGHTDALNVLLKAGCDFNQANYDGVTPAHAAAKHGHTAALNLLTKADWNAAPAYVRDGPDQLSATPRLLFLEARLGTPPTPALPGRLRGRPMTG